jgi:hypothetical protein
MELEKIREFVREYPWILAITIPGLAYILYWIRMKIHLKAKHKKDQETWSHSG